MHDYLKQLEEHWPIVAGLFAGISTFLGWRKMRAKQRQEDSDRLRRIETALGKAVLSGDDPLVTISAMEECKNTVVSALNGHAENETEKYDALHKSVTESHNRIDMIYNLLLEKNT